MALDGFHDPTRWFGRFGPSRAAPAAAAQEAEQALRRALPPGMDWREADRADPLFAARHEAFRHAHGQAVRFAAEGEDDGVAWDLEDDGAPWDSPLGD